MPTTLSPDSSNTAILDRVSESYSDGMGDVSAEGRAKTLPSHDANLRPAKRRAKRRPPKRPEHLKQIVLYIYRENKTISEVLELVEGVDERDVKKILAYFWETLLHVPDEKLNSLVGRPVGEGTQKESGQEQDHEGRLAALFSGLPEDPKTRLKAVVALQRDFRRIAAQVLQPSVSTLLSSPPSSFIEKQNLATELNTALHALGLAVRDKSFMHPCSVVPLKSQTVETGWLKLQTRKAPRRRSRPSTALTQIELVEAVREEAFGRGQ